MPKYIKILLYFFIILFVVLSFSIFYLSQIGLETKKFNILISEQVKKYNEDLNLEIEKVKIYITLDDLTNPKLKISTKEPTLILDNNKIGLKSISGKIDILSYFKDDFVIEEFEVLTKKNKIKDLIAIASLENPSLIIYNVFIKEGYANINASLKFDDNGKIANYSLNGQIKNAKLKYNEKNSFEKINFQFTYEKKDILVKNASFIYKKIKLISDEILVSDGSKGKKIVNGDIGTEINKINLKLFKDFYENQFNFINDQEITFKIENKFSFVLEKEKIKDLKYSSKIDLNNLIINPEINTLNKYFNNYNNSILLKDNIIKLIYENGKLSIDGKANYSFNKSIDKIEYKINKIKDNYDFITIINFDKNPVEIKSLNYIKKQNKKSNLKLKGSYNKNNLKFNDIIFSEGKNSFKIENLNLNKNFKILSFNKISINYLNNNNKKNELFIKKKLNYYNINGSSFDLNKIIYDILISDSEKSFLDYFNLKKDTRLSININKVYLDDKNFSKNLFGEVLIKKNKIYNLKLTSSFDNNRKFKLDVKTLKNNQKVTSFYSDNAEPFVQHYKFIKGFKDGKIDFYSVKKANLSNSTLNIFDFKVSEMPALTKLLSLASLQGIADVMTGEGIRFNVLEMNFKNKNKLMTIDEIYAIGPAISILMSGYIESNKLISLRGTLVPATTLNKVIGSLPLIGNILVGKKTGEGVFGVSFKIKGPPKKLKTSVNPIKTLTPRFITRTLEKAKKKK